VATLYKKTKMTIETTNNGIKWVQTVFGKTKIVSYQLPNENLDEMIIRHNSIIENKEAVSDMLCGDVIKANNLKNTQWVKK
jgi:hypothetical protein